MELDERTINLYENLKVPSVYWKDKSLEYMYWFRSLLQKIDTAIVFKGLPDGWCEDFFHFCLNAVGYVVVFKTGRQDLAEYGENGIVFQPCTLGGKYDFYYNPTCVQVTNPMYTKRLNLGPKGDAELLKLTPDFRGTYDIIDHYATQLAECSKGIIMSLINAKAGLIISATNSAQAEMVKKIFDKIQAGEPLVVYKNDENDSEVMPVKEPFEAWTQELSKNFILLDQIEALKEILNQFYTEIGLPVAVEKKERLVTTEADYAVAQSQARISCWVETLNEGLEKINEHFGINIEVEYACKNNSDRNGDGIEQPGRPEVDSRHMDTRK